jgi:hypothetical protein
MRVSEFLALEGEFEISSKDAQGLNRNLSDLSASDIPREKVDHVLDYLIVALNMDSVEMEIRARIDKLTTDLQEIRSQC